MLETISRRGAPSPGVRTDLETARQMLGEELLGHLASLAPALRDDVLEALSVEGKLLHQPTSALDGRWALLPFCLADDLYAGVDQVYARGAALAMECVVCATDLFDDVMDEDVTPLSERLGTARMLNVALTLISLAQRVLLALVTHDPSATLPVGMLDAVQQALLLASAGQQQDLLAERRLACDLSREECLEIAASKAGSLLSLACRLGAMCAGVDELRISQCAEMGRLLGIAAQLDNDAHDLSHLLQSSGSQKSDLKRGKKTLPVVLAAHSLRETHGLDAERVDKALQRVALSIPEASERAIAALREGILTTWGVSLLYRERAGDYAREITDNRPLSLALCQVLGLAETLAENKMGSMGDMGGNRCVVQVENASVSGAGC